jgi:hypothetical protein
MLHPIVGIDLGKKDLFNMIYLYIALGIVGWFLIGSGVLWFACWLDGYNAYGKPLFTIAWPIGLFILMLDIINDFGLLDKISKHAIKFRNRNK